MGIFNSLFSKNKTLSDFSFLATDVHSHILPGIDDGAKDVADSIEIVLLLKKLGFKKIIATPHISTEHYNNSIETVENAYSLLKTSLKEQDIEMEIEYAAEYLIDYDFERRLDTEKLLTFGNNYILIELPYFQYPQNFFHILFKLRLAGYNPILAHPERYHYWNNDIKTYEELKDKEVLLQMNILSLIGYYDIFAKKNAIQLLGKGFIDFMGTDIHNVLFANFSDKVLKNKFLKNSALLKNIKNNKL